MNRTLSLLASLLFAFAIVSCGGEKTKEQKEQKEQGTSQTETSTNDKTVGKDKKFAIEKGFMKLNIVAMGMKSDMTMYWRDYGEENATETSFNMMGIKTTSNTLRKDGYIYTWESQTGMATKTKIDDSDVELDINYRDLDKEIMKKYNIKEEGTEKVLGKTCTVYTMDIDGVKNKSWIYKGMVLKSEATAAGVKTTFVVTELKENVDPPKEVFELPENITFKEVKTENMDIDVMKEMEEEMNEMPVQ